MADEGKEISREEAQRLMSEGAQLIDVRVDHEWEAGRIAGATHLPLAELSVRSGELDRERPVVLYCRGGTRSSMATDAWCSAPIGDLRPDCRPVAMDASRGHRAARLRGWCARL